MARPWLEALDCRLRDGWVLPQREGDRWAPRGNLQVRSQDVESSDKAAAPLVPTENFIPHLSETLLSSSRTVLPQSTVGDWSSTPAWESTYSPFWSLPELVKPSLAVTYC